MPAEFFSPLAREIWQQKYQLKRNGQAVDLTLDDTFWRVARGAAANEPGGREAKERWARTFHGVMSDGTFLPGGRILAGAGTERNVTLFNCFVLGRIEDDLTAIFDAVKEAALTMQAGGGIGHDFSTLRPRGALVHSVGAAASGPVSFMDVWDSMCATIMSAGQRRGAMMATLACDHPDIEEFITVKADARRLRNFNLSVLVSDAFMDAVKADSPWDLTFDGRVYKTLPARTLWDAITRSNYACAEPGVIFIDRVNAENNLAYCETIHATNPCAEQPLPPYGACLLGSINLTRLIEAPFTAAARLDRDRLVRSVAVAVRLLDNCIDVSRYPLPAQAMEARSKRRIGLGITGLADALIMLGLPYGGGDARARAGQWMQAIQEAAYQASIDLAAAKGSFPLYDAARFADSPNVCALSEPVRSALARHGIRNGCLTSIAPTGTISLLAGNVSSGIEPVFDFIYRRKLASVTGAARDEEVEDYAHALFRRLNSGTTPSGPAWVRAGDLTPQQHLAMQAAVQAHVDSAISKTINCPADIDPKAFETLYLEAYDLGLKGCTTFRPNAVTGAVLSVQLPPLSAVEGTQFAVDPTAPAQSLHHSGRSQNAPTRDLTTRVARPPKRLQSASAARLEPQLQTGQPSGAPSAVVYLAPPLVRDAVLTGQTYEIAGSDQTYVTINDIVRDGRRRPYEIFIHSRDLSQAAWMAAVSRIISAVFRRGGDVRFIADELTALGPIALGPAPEQQAVSALGPAPERRVHAADTQSLLTKIGAIVGAHLAQLSEGDEKAVDASALAAVAEQWTQSADVRAGSLTQGGSSPFAAHRLRCGSCGSAHLTMANGCRTCSDCGAGDCG